MGSASAPASGSGPAREPSGASLALGVRRVPHLADRVRLGHQTLEIVHESVAAVFGVLVVAPDVDCLFGAHFLAIPAEDAAELVNLEHQRVPVPVFVLAGD